MGRAALGILVAATLAYIGLCAVMFFQQRTMIYFPTAPSPTPAGAATITLPVKEARVVVTAVQRGRPQALLYFGGNAEDVNGSLPALSAAFPVHDIYLMQYRGYGTSTGSPTEQALVSDALALYDAVRARHARIEVAGRSLGSGVAIQLAAARPVARLVLITPYDSLRDVAAGHYKWLPVRWLMQDHFDSGDHATKVLAPTTLVAAQNDWVIPSAQTRKLFGHFRQGVAKLIVIRGAGHNTISGDPAYVAALSGAEAARNSD